MDSVCLKAVECRNVFRVHVMVRPEERAIHIKGGKAHCTDVREWERKVHGVFYGSA
jgi:hypothetical protein